MYAKIKERLIQYWESLNSRERLLVAFLASFLLIFFFIQFGILNNRNRIQSANKEITLLREQIKSLNTLYPKYNGLRLRKQSLKNSSSQRKENEDNILSNLESFAEKSGLRSAVRYMRPSSLNLENNLLKRTVEVKLEAVPIHQVLEFLYNVEYGNRDYFIDSFRVKETFNKTSYYDITIRISSIGKK